MISFEIAVVIPVLNDKDGLFRSLASIKSERSIIIIVVDDGSFDRISSTEVHNFLDPSWQACVIRHEVNQGIVSALNDGLTESKRHNVKYVARLDAGDVCIGDRLDMQAQFLDSNTEHVVLGGQGKVVDQLGKRRYAVRLPLQDSSIRKMMHNNTAFIHPAVMFRAETLWQMEEWYSEKYIWAEDYDLFFRLLSQGKGANLEKTILAKYDTDNSISVRNRKRQLLSRLRIQCRYFSPTCLTSWIGISKTMCLLVAPASLVHKYRTIFWR